MTDTCQKGCGRVFRGDSSMEKAEQHEKTCDGHAKRRVGRKTYSVIGQDRAAPCTLCGKVAVVPLTSEQRRAQPDDTTHVCHPGFGGCNQGYAIVTTIAVKGVSRG